MPGEFGRALSRGQIRVSDAERERAVDTLREHYADGRLSSDELEERIERAYSATTRSDITALMRDLPSVVPWRARQRLAKANRDAWRAHLTSYAAVNGGLVGIWGVTGGGEFWPIWSIGGWGIAILWHGMAARATARRLERREPRSLRGRRPPPPLPR
ncbi:MAG TPA: DUF1707 domain-containing protein [Thermoleophilaceae bacterium]|nr:DUF1707 domain-containing protein [Thermoleophilaceae bacterium]